MPFQQVNLDQSVYNKPKSTYSKALTPQRKFLGTQDTSNRFVQEQEAKWAAEDKVRKAERDAQIQKAQEMGMRIQSAYEKEKETGRQQSAQIKAEKEQKKAAIPAMAMEAYSFAMTLDEEGQKSILDKVKAKPEIANYLRDKGIINPKGEFVKLGRDPLESSWAIEDGFLIDKKAEVPTYYETPEKEADKFDPSKMMETYDSNGNLYLLYDGKALTPSDKEPDMPKTGENAEKVIKSATSIADGVAMKGTPQWDEAFKSAVSSVGEAFGLNAEETLNLSKVSGIKYGQAAALSTQFADAGYSPEMMTEEFKSQILKANPTLTAQTLNAAIEQFSNNYNPEESTATTTQEEPEEEKVKRELNPKIKKAATGISDALKAITGR